MDSRRVLEALEPWLAQHRRAAWRPRIRRSWFRRAPRSHFGGLPLLAEGEGRPICGTCGREMPLFLQLDLAELPASLHDRWGPGLLQLFYCTGVDRGCCEREDWLPFDSGHLVRILPPDVHVASATPSRDHPAFPSAAIGGWDHLWDLPEAAEHEGLGIRYDYDWDRNTVIVVCTALGMTLGPLDASDEDDEGGIAEAIGRCAPGDKLGGWPDWVQGVEYPRCPQCGCRMKYLLQLDSNDHVPYLFGDMGRGHLTQCPQHRDVLAFAWACS